ncbi:hypothetical protein [Paenisporosarcina indica]|uniref:hypothetical protein n=1 Tax=Paenisporosarcina indica TaxID=650093 RepID=UPI00094FAC6A|nr:hypothetical protein [Paenisporosarcina indica]
MNKVEFKKSFDLGGYEEIVFTANNDETTIWINNKYSCPSSTISSKITKIAGTLYEERRWGFIFSELIEINSNIDAQVNIDLGGYEIDDDDLDEDGFQDEDFLDFLIEQATNEIKNSEYPTALKKMTAL